MINIELYKIFYKVAEVQNITKAAEELHISQPAVTKQLKNLEEQLGNPLFIRTKKGVILNEYGQKIYLKVKQALSLLDECEKQLQDNVDNMQGTIKIGIGTILMCKYLLTYLQDFHKLYPNVKIEIYTEPTKKLIPLLKQGQIDMIVGKFPYTKDLDLKYTKLGQSKYIFAANNNYSNLKNKKIPVSQLKKYPIILQNPGSNNRTSADRYFKDNNISIKSKANIATASLLIDFISIGYGIGYVTKLYVEDKLKNKELFEIDITPKPEKVHFGLMTLKNTISTNVCLKFINCLSKSKHEG